MSVQSLGGLQPSTGVSSPKPSTPQLAKFSNFEPQSAGSLKTNTSNAPSHLADTSKTQHLNSLA